MDAYDRCNKKKKKNLADSVAIYARGRELFGPPTYKHLKWLCGADNMILRNRTFPCHINNDI
jgi:hypothetical protein